MISQRFILISLALLWFSLRSSAEVNLVKNNQAISLMSSAERSRLGTDSKQVEDLCKNQAQALCSRVGKQFKRYVIAEISSENIKEKSYKAMTWQSSIEGLSFTEATFPIVVFPEKIPPLVKAEYAFYVTSGMILATGGLMTLLMCIETYGSTDFFAAKVTAGLTAGLSAVTALGGAGVHIRRAYLESKREAGEDEEYVELSPIPISYALPMLVSELWCE